MKKIGYVLIFCFFNLNIFSHYRVVFVVGENYYSESEKKEDWFKIKNGMILNKNDYIKVKNKGFIIIIKDGVKYKIKSNSINNIKSFISNKKTYVGTFSGISKIHKSSIMQLGVRGSKENPYEMINQWSDEESESFETENVIIEKIKNYIDSSNYTEALKYLENKKNRIKNINNKTYMKAICLYQLGDVKVATNLFKKYLKLENINEKRKSVALYYIAMYSFYFEQYNSSIKYLNRFITEFKKDELSSEVYLLLAYSHMKLKNNELANVYLKKILNEFKNTRSFEIAKKLFDKK